jgi:purine nucleosidase
MGGTSDGVGNVTPVAEYNIWADQAAARTVFGSGARITMVGWDVSRKYAVFPPHEADELRGLGPLGEFAVDIQRTLAEFCRTQTKLAGFDLPDPIAMAVALDPRVPTRTVHAYIEISDEGETVLTDGDAVDVVVEASRERFVALLRDALRG